MDKYIADIIASYLSNTSLHDVPQEFRDNPLLSANNCPKCGHSGRWRSGVGFEHMKRCGACMVVWCPYDVEVIQGAMAEALKLYGGDGI